MTITDTAPALLTDAQRRAVAPLVHGGTNESIGAQIHLSAEGPGARIDRIYTSHQFLPAVREVEVIDMSGLSDHHTVVVRLDRDTLTDILNHPLNRAA